MAPGDDQVDQDAKPADAGGGGAGDNQAARAA